MSIVCAEEEFGWSEWIMPGVVEQKEGWGEERMEGWSTTKGTKVLVSRGSVIPLNHGVECLILQNIT